MSASTTFEVRLVGTVGAAEVLGLDCSQPFSPETVAEVPESYTGQYLRPMLLPRRPTQR